MAGALAAGGIAFTPEVLLKLLAVWLLADPVLGVMWGLGVDGGLWRRLANPQLPGAVSPLPLLPYTQPGSPGRRLADHLGRVRLWWQNTFWPQAGQEFASLVAALGLALLLGLILGREALALASLSFVLSWIAGLSQDGDSPKSGAHRPAITLMRALAEFGIPWLIGVVVMGRLSWTVMALGLCYTITYFGLIHHTHDFRMVAAGQVAGALLLAGLRHPLTAAVTMILLMPQWGLKVSWTAGQPTGHMDSRAPYLRGVQSFVILSVLVAALALSL